ncbi:MAG: hypothetical protein ABI604_04725 [Nitrospirota bacterium]
MYQAVLMRTSRRIPDEDRSHISALRTAGNTPAKIGKALGFSHGPVTRKLARNTGLRGDRVQHAPRTAQSRPQQVRPLPRTLTIGVRRALARTRREAGWSRSR